MWREAERKLNLVIDTIAAISKLSIRVVPRMFLHPRLRKTFVCLIYMYISSTYLMHMSYILNFHEHDYKSNINSQCWPAHNFANALMYLKFSSYEESVFSGPINFKSDNIPHPHLKGNLNHHRWQVKGYIWPFYTFNS